MPSPAITNIDPTGGPLSTAVSITGTNFGTSQGTSGVTFNGTAALAVTLWSDTMIQAAVPNGATTGNVLVTTGSGISNGVLFTVTPSSLPVSVDQFLIDIPELDTSGVTAPGKVQISRSSIALWLNVAFKMLNAQRWPDPDIYALGLEQFAAHHVVLEVLAQRDMDVGGVPGVATGMVVGKSSSDVSIAYAPQAVLELDAGHFNYTSFGLRFIHLARMMGAGPIQVNAGCGGGGNAGAYAGPWTSLFPNPS